MEERERAERRHSQLREAQRRWRQRHPDAARKQTALWYQRPDVKARKAAYMREYRKQKKETDMTTMTTDDTYNGWANRETWALYLWLSNDEGFYGMMRGIARRVLPEEEGELSGSEEDKVKEALTDWYMDLLEMGGEGARVTSDIGSLWRVDWEEITHAMWEDYYG